MQKIFNLLVKRLEVIKIRPLENIFEREVLCDFGSLDGRLGL